MFVNFYCVYLFENGFDFLKGVICLLKYWIDLIVYKFNWKKELIKIFIKKKYLIELEEYDGFVMIKYYFYYLKKDKNCYK